MWCVVCGVWYVVCGMWHVVCGMWYVVCDMWYVVCGVWLVCGTWYVVCGKWCDLRKPGRRSVKLKPVPRDTMSTSTTNKETSLVSISERMMTRTPSPSCTVRKLRTRSTYDSPHWGIRSLNGALLELTDADHLHVLYVVLDRRIRRCRDTVCAVPCHCSCSVTAPVVTLLP